MKFFKHVKGLTLAALAIALLCVAFASNTKAKAAEDFTATYDPQTDTVTIVPTDDSVEKVTVYSFKSAEAGQEIKKAKKVEVNVVTGGATLVLNNNTGGFKIAENKPAYFYITVATGTAATVTPNFNLAATDVKKINSVTFKYSKAYANSTATDVIVVKYTVDGATEPTTATISQLKIGDLVGTEKTPSTIFVGENQFTGDDLYKIISDTEKKNNKEVARKHKLNVQILGSADPFKTTDNVQYNGKRSAKAKAVSPKSIAKAPKAKVDYLKGTIALKAGFDYVVLSAEPVSGAATIPATSWRTILPVDADGTAVKAVMDSTTYTYYKKMPTDTTEKEAAKAFFYNGDKKAKTLNLADICDEAWNESASGTAIIYVRKTATDKAPASAASEKIVVNKAAAAPTVAVSGASVTISTYDAKKKLFKTIPAFEGANDGAKAGSEYEILVVTQADLKAGDIDWSKVKWTKFNPTKGLKLKLSSKISYTTKDKEAATVSTVDGEGNLVADVIILVRGAGVKEAKKNGKTVPGALPTEQLKTKIVSVGSGDDATFEWQLVK